jgi:hypothetical protein
MARLAMNFAHGARRWPVKALLLVGALGSLHALWQREQLLVQVDEQSALIERLEESLDRRNFKVAAATQESPEAQAEARRLVAELQQPWEAMFDALQQAAKHEVLITRLQPGNGAGQLVVNGQADSSEAFLAFVTRLRRQPEWAVVEPVSQEHGSAPVPGGKPLGFQLELSWRMP